jgi:hypothetical protein
MAVGTLTPMHSSVPASRTTANAHSESGEVNIRSKSPASIAQSLAIAAVAGHMQLSLHSGALQQGKARAKGGLTASTVPCGLGQIMFWLVRKGQFRR